MKSAFAVLALTLLPPQSDSLALTPAKGAQLTKSFSMAVELELEKVSMRIGDRDLPAEALEKFEMSMSFGSQFEVQDEYVAVEGSRATELVRHFTSASQSNKQHFAFPPAEPKDEDKTVESPLVDHEVVFTWDPKQEKYTRAFRGDEGEQAWLEKLEQEIDFEHLLPQGKVEVGDTWKIDSKFFEAISAPGGSLSFPTKDDNSDPFDDDLKGTIDARYDGQREVDGHMRAVIHVTAALKTSVEKSDEDSAPTEVEISLDLEGDYLWDTEHGRLASYALVGPSRFTTKVSRELEAGGQTRTMRMEFTLAGECQLSGRVE